MPKIRGKKADEPFKARFQLTSEDEDRDGDVIITAGLDWSTYEKNPVVLLGHQNKIPVGSSRAPDGTSSIEVGVGKAYGTCYFHEQTTESKETAELVRRGILNAASIGFVPDKSKMTKSGRGHRIAKGKVLEWSIVAVPACESCLREELKDFSEPVVKAVMDMAKGGECACQKDAKPACGDMIAKHVVIMPEETPEPPEVLSEPPIDYTDHSTVIADLKAEVTELRKMVEDLQTNAVIKEVPSFVKLPPEVDPLRLEALERMARTMNREVRRLVGK